VLSADQTTILLTLTSEVASWQTIFVAYISPNVADAPGYGDIRAEDDGTTAVDLSAIAAGIGVFVINGQAAGERSGWSVAAAGDVNGDGLADLIAGAY
jgi:hypothetical protein